MCLRAGSGVVEEEQAVPRGEQEDDVDRAKDIVHEDSEERHRVGYGVSCESCPPGDADRQDNERVRKRVAVEMVCVK